MAIRWQSRQLSAIHSFASCNRDLVDASVSNGEMCGCFYCVNTFRASKVKKYVGKNADRALCPMCGIDSVLPGCVISLSPYLLHVMRHAYFDHSLTSSQVKRRHSIMRKGLRKLTKTEKKVLMPDIYDNHVVEDE